MKPNATVFFIILRTSTDKNGNSPIRMVVYDGKDRKRYGIGISVNKSNWKKIFETKLKDKELQKIRAELNGLRIRAEKIIAEINSFSFKVFEEQFFYREQPENIPAIPSLKSLFDQYLTDLKSKEQIGTYISYQTTINSIESFKASLLLSEVTPAFLQEYETHLTAKGNSPSTIGIYMRQLRAVLNRAIKSGLMEDKDYPFRHYVIPAARNIKQALNDVDLEKLFKYTSEDLIKQKAIDFWIFSYLCNGMNFTDIAHLKKESIEGGYLVFVRQKTKRTKKRDLTPIRVGLHKRAIEVIQKHGNSDEHNPYLFPILEPDLSPITIKHRCQRLIKWENMIMETIRLELGIEKPLNTYAARHSFSTFLKRKGVSTSYIKESLGHSSEATTESYLASFTDDVKLQYASLLTDFGVKKEIKVVEPDKPKRLKKKKT